MKKGAVAAAATVVRLLHSSPGLIQVAVPVVVPYPAPPLPIPSSAPPPTPSLSRVLGPAVKEPDDPIWAANGGDLSDPDPLGSPDEWAELVDYEDEDGPYPIEQAIVVTYDDGRTLAYRTQTERNYVEYHEGLWGKIVDEQA